MSGTQEEQATRDTQDTQTSDHKVQGVPDGQDAAAQAAAGAAEDTAEGGEKKEKPWFQKRIDELTAEKWTARREKEAAEERAREAEARAELLSMGRKEGEKDTSPADHKPLSESPLSERPLSESDLDALAERKAEEKLRAATFNQACNDVYEAGKKEFADFDGVLGNFRDIGGLSPALVETAIETGAAHKVLYALGQDRDEAYRIMRLSPVKMAMELTKLAAKAAQPPAAAPVSKAPEPIRPVRGASNADVDPEKLSTADWMKWREEQLQARRA